MPPLELPHERHQRLAACLREGVVDARAHPAHRAVPFEAVETPLRGLADEFGLQLLARRTEADVHERATLGLGGAAEEAARVEVVVDELGLLLIAPSHRLEAAELLDPLEYAPHDVD